MRKNLLTSLQSETSTVLDLEEYTLELDHSEGELEYDIESFDLADMESFVVNLKSQHGGMMSQAIVESLQNSLEGFEAGYPTFMYTQEETDTLASETWEGALQKAKEITSKSIEVGKVVASKVKAGIVKLSERNANSTDKAAKNVAMSAIVADQIKESSRKLSSKDRLEASKVIANSVAKSKLKRELSSPVRSLVAGASDFNKVIGLFESLDSEFVKAAKDVTNGNTADLSTIESEFNTLSELCSSGSGTVDVIRLSKDLDRALDIIADLKRDVDNLEWSTRDIVVDAVDSVGEGNERYATETLSYAQLRYAVIKDVEALTEFVVRHGIRYVKMMDSEGHDTLMTELKKIK